MKNIKINIPEGFEIDTEKSSLIEGNNEWQQGYEIWQAGFIEGEKAGAAEQKAIDDAAYVKCLNEAAAKDTNYGKLLEQLRDKMINDTCEWLMDYFKLMSSPEIFCRDYRKYVKA